MKELERALPHHHQRWIRGGITAAAVGYLLVAVTQSGSILVQSEFWIGVACCVLLGLSRFKTQWAAYAGLLIIWVELIWSLAENEAGLRSASSVALPVWIVVVTLFSGGRLAWIATISTMLAVPVATYLGWPALHPGERRDESLAMLVVVEMCLLSAAWLVTQFMAALVESVNRDRLNASRTAQFMEKAPDAMVGVASGKIVAFNALAERYFGVPRREMLGRRVRDLPVYNAERASLFELAKTKPQDLVVDGCVLETRVQILEHEGAAPEELYVFRDVTERHAAEAKAQELQVQLEHAQRMEAIGQLAGGIAHDFNNLLTAFSGTAELLMDSDDEEVRELAGELDAASSRGAALTRQLLTFARRDVVQRRVLDLGDVVETTRTLLEHLLGERIVVNFDLTRGCHIEGDQAQIEQVVLNLATNARDAISGSGSLTFRTESDGDLVRLIAKDSGRGMDEETRQHIFEPFFTTKPRDKGTGLGLSTVHGIVTRAGGTITVESKLAGGTTFIITFPQSARGKESLKPPPRISRKVPMHGHLLLVEDDGAARDITRRILERSGFSVTTATSAEEALALCRDGVLPDALVSDVVMRGLTGVELAERLRQRSPDLPVLFISGYVDDVLSNWPFDTTQDLLLKPFSGEELVSRVRDKLKEHKTRSHSIFGNPEASREG